MKKLSVKKEKNEMKDQVNEFVNEVNGLIADLVKETFGVMATAPVFMPCGEGNFSCLVRDEEMLDVIYVGLKNGSEESDPLTVKMKGIALYLNRKREVKKLPTAQEFKPVMMTASQIGRAVRGPLKNGWVVDEFLDEGFIFKNSSEDIPTKEELVEWLQVPKERISEITFGAIQELVSEKEKRSGDRFSVDSDKAFRINMKGLEPLCDRYKAYSQKGEYMYDVYTSTIKGVYHVIKNFFPQGANELNIGKMVLVESAPQVRGLGKVVGLEPMTKEKDPIAIAKAMRGF